MRSLCFIVLAACSTAPPPAAPRAIDIDVQALLDAHENVGGALSPDGTRLLFRSDRGGVPELYLSDVARPDAPATRLVAGPERVASGVFTRDGRAVLFRRDTGADENFHIFRVVLDGSAAPIDLTPGAPIWRDSPLVPRGRPDLMVYSERAQSDYASMIVAQDLAGGEPRIAFRDPGPATIVDVSADASRALWFREADSGGHDLLEVELATGEARPISPSDGTAAMVTAGAYSADGTRIFVATDHGSERHVVEELDRASLEVVATYAQDAPASAEVSAIVASPDGRRVAITVDAGNRSSVRILDATTLAVVADVDTPLGTTTVGVPSETRVSLGTDVFAHDGAHFAIEVSLPDAPDDVYLVDASTGTAAPLRREIRPALAKLPRTATSIATVHAFDGLAIPVNVHVPAAASRLPTLVWLHGGPDASTTLEWSAWTRVLGAAGYVVLEPNIRGSTGFGRAYARADDREHRYDALRDLESVNAWARKQPWCDPDRLVIAGASFGGYYVLMALAHQPQLWRAGIDLAGPSDLMTMLTKGATPKRYVEELGDPVADRELINELSPIRAVDHVVAPLFVYQGENDAHVPRAQADSIVAALRRRGIPVEYMLASDEGHTVARRANEVELLVRMLRFLRERT